MNARTLHPRRFWWRHPEQAALEAPWLPVVRERVVDPTWPTLIRRHRSQRGG
jgi:hypothetical protein